MLQIRHDQLLLMREALRHQATLRLADGLRAYAQPVQAALPESAWWCCVEGLTERAAAYGIEEAPDSFLFSVFALQCSWFDDGAAHFEWARSILLDSRVSCARARVVRLIDEAQYRHLVAAGNGAYASMLFE